MCGIVGFVNSRGLEKALFRFRGMFAFAVYDFIAGELFLACDRTGVKPFHHAPHLFLRVRKVNALFSRVCGVHTWPGADFGEEWRNSFRRLRLHGCGRSLDADRTGAHVACESVLRFGGVAPIMFLAPSRSWRESRTHRCSPDFNRLSHSYLKFTVVMVL